MDTFSFITKKGSETKSVFDELALLRITVFRDYPYLYEGSIEYENNYLGRYTQSDRSFLFAVYYAGKMVGATTCIPLQDETAEIREPFEKKGYDVGTFFYFGESILLPEFRGMGLGHRFFDEREAHARSFGIYKKACFFSVIRQEDHPAKPQQYHSNDAFWKKRGYNKILPLKARLEWPDIGETKSSPKQLVCWIKDL